MSNSGDRSDKDEIILRAHWHHTVRSSEPESSLQKLAGKFIVFDGPDGAGKTTQLASLKQRLEAEGLTVLTARDPGGTAVGEGIRQLLLNLPKEAGRPVPVCELLLFMASRAQLVAEVIAPALVRGETVLCDRFVWSTLAYQAANGTDIKEILGLARSVVGACWPDVTLLLDVPPEIGFSRIAESRKAVLDAIEERGLEYRRKVRDLYLTMPLHFRAPMVILDATSDRQHVQEAIDETLRSIEFEASRALLRSA